MYAMQNDLKLLYKICPRASMHFSHRFSHVWYTNFKALTEFRFRQNSFDALK